MIIGFTGSRQGMTLWQHNELAAIFHHEKITTLHHGDCIGSDSQAHALALLNEIPVIVHPPVNHKYRALCIGAEHTYPELPYGKRDRIIVDSCNVLIATPSTNIELTHSGTWATIRYARKVNRPVVIIKTDGTKCR